MLSMRLHCVFFPLYFFNKLRPIFCSVRNTQYTQSSRKEDNMGRWFFSHWQRWLWRKTPSTPDRRRTYGLVITQSPDALPQSYKTFFGAKDTKLGFNHVTIILQHYGKEDSPRTFFKGLSGFVIEQLFI